jgi:hypothetical protein
VGEVKPGDGEFPSAGRGPASFQKRYSEVRLKDLNFKVTNGRCLEGIRKGREAFEAG